MLIALVPVLVMLLGGIMWFVSSNPKVADAGRGLFFIGVFFIVWQLSGRTVTIG